MSEALTVERRLEHWQQEEARLSNHVAVKAYISSVLVCKELEGILEVVQKEGKDE